MNLLPRVGFCLGLASLVACGSSFDGVVAESDSGTTTDSSVGDAGSGTDSGLVDSGRPADSDGGPTLADSGVRDSGTTTDSGTTVLGLCDGLNALGSNDFQSTSTSGTGVISTRTGGYTASVALNQDGAGDAYLPTRLLQKSKVCATVDVTLSNDADNLNAAYTLVGGTVGIANPAAFGMEVTNGRVNVGYANGSGTSVNVGARKNFRLELSVENGINGSKLHYRIRAASGTLGEGDLAGGGGAGISLVAGVSCKANGGSCKALTVEGNSFGVFSN